jgi:hypothetical protein
MVDLTQERDVDTLRQVSLLLDREVQRLITKNLQLTTELARLRGVADPERLALAELRALQQRRAEVLTPAPTPSAPSRPACPGHGPRSQPALPTVDIRHELPPDQRAVRAADLLRLNVRTTVVLEVAQVQARQQSTLVRAG